MSDVPKGVTGKFVQRVLCDMAIGPSIPSEVGVFRKNIVRRKNIRGFDVLSFWGHFRPKLLLKNV